MSALSCDDAVVLLADLYGDIPETDAQRLKAHLAGCASCRARAGDFVQQDRLISEIAAHEFEAAIRESIQRKLTAAKALPSRTAPKVLCMGFRVSLALAAMVLLGV